MPPRVNTANPLHAEGGGSAASVEARDDSSERFASAASVMARLLRLYFGRTFRFPGVSIKLDPGYLGRQIDQDPGFRDLEESWAERPETHQAGWNRFCRLVRRSAPGNERCEKCDAAAMARARTLTRSHRYRCHAGLTEMVAPVWDGSQYVGVFITGQALSQRPTDSEFDRIWRGLRSLPGLSREELRAAYYQLPVLDEERLAASADFMELLASEFMAHKAMCAEYASKERHCQDISVLARSALAERLIFDPELPEDEALRSLRAVDVRERPNLVFLLDVSSLAAGAPSMEGARERARASLELLTLLDKDLADPNALSFCSSGRHLAFLTWLSPSRSAAAERLRVAELGNRILSRAQALSGGPCRIAAGPCVARVADLAPAYRAALMSLQGGHRLWQGVFGLAASPEPRGSALLDREAVEGILRSLAQGRYDPCRLALGQLIGQTTLKAETVSVDSRVYLISIAITLLEAARLRGVAEESLRERQEAFLQSLSGRTRADHYEAAVMGLLERLIEEIEKPGGRTDEARIRAVIEYMRRKLHEPPTLQGAARHVTLSPRQTARVFRKVTGRDFSSCLNGMRLERAKRLLEEEIHSVNSVARQTGFSSPSNFIRFFRKATGKTPRAFLINR